MTLRWNPRMMWILLCLNIALLAFALGRLVEQYEQDPLLDRLSGALHNCKEAMHPVQHDKDFRHAVLSTQTSNSTGTSITIDGEPLWRWTP